VHVKLFLLLVGWLSLPALFVFIAVGASGKGFVAYWRMWFRSIGLMVLLALGLSLLFGLFALA
jgi:hypothetical protein